MVHLACHMHKNGFKQQYISLISYRLSLIEEFSDFRHHSINSTLKLSQDHNIGIDSSWNQIRVNFFSEDHWLRKTSTNTL